MRATYSKTALDFDRLCADQRNPRRGFYLIHSQSSQQAGLTGLKGGNREKSAMTKLALRSNGALGVINKSGKARTD